MFLSFLLDAFSLLQDIITRFFNRINDPVSIRLRNILTGAEDGD